jgi:ATP-dependent exoDNAse (exonuclease V) beta subunit
MPREQQNIYWLDKLPRFNVGKLPKKLSPSYAAPIKGAKIGKIIELGERIPFSGAPDMATFGSCLHAIIATEIIHRDMSETRAKRILQDFGMTDFIEPRDAMVAAKRFIDQVDLHYAPITWHVEYPIQYVNAQAQECKGYIDLAVETEQGWVIIDHKSSPRKKSEWEDICLTYSGQLSLYRDALTASGKTVASCWIHFAITGGLVSVDL